MDLGTIAVRYAKALLSFAAENEEEDGVYREMEALGKIFFQMPQLKTLLVNPVVTDEEKINILLAATGQQMVSKTTKAFVPFVVERNRQSYMHQISLSFASLYRKERNIVFAQLTTAGGIEQAAVRKVVQAMEKEYGGTVLLQQAIAPELIGGFVLDVENRRLDASIAGELKTIKKKLVTD